METVATIKPTKNGVEVLKFCYSCGLTQWCEVVDSHTYRCLTCHRPPNNGHYYVSKYGTRDEPLQNAVD